MGEMCMMNGRGDFRVTWNPNDLRSVEDAKAEFDRLLKAGNLIFAVDPLNDSRGKQIKKFDPLVQKVIVSPPMAGG